MSDFVTIDVCRNRAGQTCIDIDNYCVTGNTVGGVSVVESLTARRDLVLRAIGEDGAGHDAVMELLKEAEGQLICTDQCAKVVSFKSGLGDGTAECDCGAQDLRVRIERFLKGAKP